MKALVLAAALVSAAAVAATAEPAARVPEEKMDDQSRVVCIKSAEIGSRLRQRRVCRTKAQWDEYRSNIRTIVSRMQATKEAPGE